ncbi:helix-turn-helix domain-containing protein [Asaia astilbis]|uniref:helix-turn-helix domain-containing protein n=1 Tax=Asaia astilbis TaxID=610244 RepID=UPI0004713B73|nr:helix-turn-helix transcriptional regulator [Asaia astilbis]
MSGSTEKQAAIADRLSKRMREVGVSQKELADLAGTSKQQIWKLENAKVSLKPEWAERLSPHLSVTPAWLLMIDAGQTDLPPAAPDDQRIKDALHAKQEKVLLGIWRHLSLAQRKHLLGLMEAIMSDRDSSVA